MLHTILVMFHQFRGVCQVFLPLHIRTEYKITHRDVDMYLLQAQSSYWSGETAEASYQVYAGKLLVYPIPLNYLTLN